MRSILGIFLFSFLVSLYACVDSYPPDVGIHTPKLIVDGLISNQPGPYVVRLSFSQPYISRDPTAYVSGATVVIQDNQGNKEQLLETNPGEYRTKANGLRGTVGNAYFLEIKLTNGKQYRSKPEVLAAAPQIDTVSSVFRPGNVVKDGFDAFVEFKDDPNQPNYYRWKWKHYSRVSLCKFVKRAPPEPPIYVYYNCCSQCWNIESSTKLDLQSDAFINGNKVKHYLTTVPYDSTKPYNLVVEQYSLTKSAYEFWNQTNTQINNSGGIFDAPPATILGNVYNPDDPNDQALGYFNVAGLTVKSVYVNRKNAPRPPYTITPTVRNFVYSTTCEPCKDGLYRTPNTPPGWMDIE